METIKIEELHKKYCDEVEKISIKGFDKINLRQLLFLDLYSMLQINSFLKLGASFISALCRNHFSCKRINQGENVIVLSVEELRNDYILQWEGVKSVLPRYTELVVNKNAKAKLLSISKIIGRFVHTLSWNNSLKFIRNRKHRLYLLLVLLYHFDELLYLSKLDWKGKKLGLVFFDSGHFENIFVQKCKIEKVKTITLQHGQPLYRGELVDRYNQATILNMTADVSICRGQFSKQQFLKYNVDERRVPVLGEITENHIALSKTEEFDNKDICVFLDTIDRENGLEFNIKFLQMINSFCSKYGKKVSIKKHPSDQTAYDQYIEQKYVKIYYDKSVRIFDMENMIGVGIVHTSSSFVDLLFYGITPMKYVTDVYYPITDSQANMFSNIDELNEKLELWKSMKKEDRHRAIFEMQTYYRCSASMEKYQQFISNFIDA